MQNAYCSHLDPLECVARMRKSGRSNVRVSGQNAQERAPTRALLNIAGLNTTGRCHLFLTQAKRLELNAQNRK